MKFMLYIFLAFSHFLPFLISDSHLFSVVIVYSIQGFLTSFCQVTQFSGFEFPMRAHFWTLENWKCAHFICNNLMYKKQEVCKGWTMFFVCWFVVLYSFFPKKILSYNISIIHVYILFSSPSSFHPHHFSLLGYPSKHKTLLVSF